MQLKQVIVDEDNKPLLLPRDGFIIEGNIYVAAVRPDGKPYGGLVGDNFDPEHTKIVRYQALSKNAMIRTLGYSLIELLEIVADLAHEQHVEVRDMLPFLSKKLQDQEAYTHCDSQSGFMNRVKGEECPRY